MLRACLIAFDSRRWCVVHTPVSRRGTIFPRSATNPCSSRTSRYEMASIFSVQNLQTFLRRKNFRPPAPPGPPGPRPPGPEGRPAGASGLEGVVVASSAIFIPPAGRRYRRQPYCKSQIVPNALRAGRCRGFSSWRRRRWCRRRRCRFRRSLNRRGNRRSRRNRAQLLLRRANRPNLGQPLLLLIHPHRDELDHRLGNTQPPLQFRNQHSVGVDGEQHIVAVVEFPHHVCQLPLPQLLRRADLAAAAGHRLLQTGNQLVQILVGHIRPHDKHHFIKTLHRLLLFLPNPWGPATNSLPSVFTSPPECSRNLPHPGG